jgi:hypothetical protein
LLQIAIIALVQVESIRDHQHKAVGQGGSVDKEQKMELREVKSQQQQSNHKEQGVQELSKVLAPAALVWIV